MGTILNSLKLTHSILTTLIRLKTNTIPMLQIRKGKKKEEEEANRHEKLVLVIQLDKWEHWDAKLGSQWNSFKLSTRAPHANAGKTMQWISIKIFNENLNAKAVPLCPFKSACCQ